MSELLRQDRRTGTTKTIARGWEAISKQYIPGQRTIINFSNKKSTYASCLRCPDTPCLKLSSPEMNPSNFDRFPADRNSNTCAAMAISISATGAPIIAPDRCVMCGVCASRCPVGAIRLEPGIGAVVEDKPNAAFVEDESPTEHEHKAFQRVFSNLGSSGTMLEENDEIIDYAPRPQVDIAK